MTTSENTIHIKKSRIVSESTMNSTSKLNKSSYSKWSRLFGLSALTLALSACQTIPGFNNEPVVAHPNIPLNPNEGYELYANSQVPPSFAAMRWQSFYTDPKLKSLIQLGLENNKDVRQAVLAIQRARAQYRISDNEDLPTLNGNAGYSRSANNAQDSNPSDNYNIGLGLASYELDFWGRISSLKEQALQNYLSTTAAKDTAQVSLIANIARSYVDLSYQLKQLDLATQTLQSREESLRITNARLQAGIDSRQPSLQAAASAETARIAALNAQTGVLRARNALKYLVGAPITDAMLPEPAVKSIATDKALSAGLPSELLRYRPDVLQAEYQLKAAGANINVARAAYYPTISLTGDFGYRSGDLSDLFKSSASSWSFGPSISIPIFDAGQRDANYEIAQIEQEQALADYEDTIETAFREVNDVLADRATLKQRLESQYRLQESYNGVLEIAQARYKAQVDDYLSVLDAERSLFSAQQSILNLEQENLTNQIELYQALGGGANLVDPKEIPSSQHRNLVNILDRPSNEQRAINAIDAASAPRIVTAEQAKEIEGNSPTRVVRYQVTDDVDLNNNNRPDALFSDVSSTTVPPSGTSISEDGAVQLTPNTK